MWEWHGWVLVGVRKEADTWRRLGGGWAGMPGWGRRGWGQSRGGRWRVSPRVSPSLSPTW